MSVTRSATTDDAAQRLTCSAAISCPEIVYRRYAEKKIIRWWSGWLTWPYTARCRKKSRRKRIHERIYGALQHSVNAISNQPRIQDLAKGGGGGGRGGGFTGGAAH